MKKPHQNRQKPTSSCEWGCDPESFQVEVCQRGCSRRGKGWWRCVSGPRWKPALEHSWERSQNIWSTVESRTAPLISAAPLTRRLDTPWSCQAGSGSPAPKTDMQRCASGYTTKMFSKIKCVFFFFLNLIIILQCCHKANSKAINQLFVGCLEDDSGVPAGQSAAAESIESMTETNVNNIDLMVQLVSWNNWRMKISPVDSCNKPHHWVALLAGVVVNIHSNHHEVFLLKPTSMWIRMYL